MTPSATLKIALAGNPNSGKSSIFNRLTGLNQKTGNYPGVTVDKKTAKLKLSSGRQAEIVDLPGTYSIYPKSEDERVVWEVLSNKDNPDHPEIVVVVADATNLKRNLLLFTQIIDLGFRTVLLLNMIDLAGNRKKVLDAELLAERLKVPVIRTNARVGVGIDELLSVIDSEMEVSDICFNPKTLEQSDGNFIDADLREDVLSRYRLIDDLLVGIISDKGSLVPAKKTVLDKILIHPVFGYVIFLAILLFMFQAIFKWAEYPMNLIDNFFMSLASTLVNVLPPGVLTDLLTGGLIPGLAGILIFIPQIAILFAVVSLLEESGYMSRVVFLMDKMMSKVGLNGRSVVPLISGVACAVPAIMASRTISNKKDRLITMLVTPLMSCSARLPVYTILIALVIPANDYGIFSLQGLALLFMYFIGFFMALIAALVFKLILKTKEKSYLVMEMPVYQLPKVRTMVISVYDKTKTFVFEAGKIIIMISILLWVLATYGPADKMKMAEVQADKYAEQYQLNTEQKEAKLAALKLENSFAGHFGKVIEPAIRPLGYDWKIGIALISSFAAREVFVGTMATIYSVGNTNDEMTVKESLKKEVNPDTGEQRFTLAVGLSLMMFYAFAMQCMSTLAVVYRETKSLKWPVVQFIYMFGLAYASAFIVYQIFR